MGLHHRHSHPHASWAGVVLNQLVAELGAPEELLPTTPPHQLSSRLESAVWLDPGLSEQGAVLPTDHGLLRRLAGRLLAAAAARGAPPPRLTAAFTPRQLADPDEPWVAEQLAACKTCLDGAGLPLRVERHFFWRPASLDAHFRILDAFGALEGTSATSGLPRRALLCRRLVRGLLAPLRW